MRKLMTVAAACLLAACSGQTVTGPDPVTQAPEAPAPVAQATPAPQPVAEPSGKQHVGTIAGATFSIQNNSGTFARYAARIYEVLAGGEQQLAQEILSGDVPAGQSWGGQFAKLPCNYQIDLDHYFVVVNPPAPGEIAHKIVVGNVCREPEPEPTPTPQPTPTPSPSPSPTPSPSPSPSPTPEPCEAPEFWDQSFTANKNEIKFNVHARGQGTWTLTLYATSSMSEYTNNDPDYTKDVDTDIVTKCKNGQTELKVDYDWRYHSSRYWWAVIRFNDVVKWKSAAVDHTLYD